MSLKTQCSVLTVASTNKMTDAVWKIFYPLSSQIYIIMAKWECDNVRPFPKRFYYQYADDCFSKRKNDKPGDLLQRLNSYHANRHSFH